MKETVVAVYLDRKQARQAFTALVESGVDPKHISLLTEQNADDVHEISGRQVAEGAASGAVGGGLVGGMVALAALAIPGLGPIVAAGPIAATLTGLTVGAAAGGVLGALTGLGLPAEDAEAYAEAVRRGATLVAVNVDDTETIHVRDILDSHSPIDLADRVESWREEGWTGFNYQGYEAYKPYFQNLHRIEYGDVPFAHYEPAYLLGYTLATEPDYAGKDDWDALEASAQEAWEKENYGPWDTFKDAIYAGWHRVKEAGREAVDAVEDFFEEDDGYDDYRDRFLTHYHTYFTSSYYPYDDFDRAYRYGYALATYDRYEGASTWDEVKEDAQEEWEEHFLRPWAEFKEAVRHAWEAASGRVARAVDGVTNAWDGR